MDSSNPSEPGTSGARVADARTCILHIEQPSTSTSSEQPSPDVLSFNPEKWAVVKEAASKRALKKNFKGSKYFQVVQSLPNNVAISQGYHVQCYKNFTAVPQTGVTVSTPAPKQLRSNIQSPPGSCPSGIFPMKCLFCRKVRRKKGSTEETLTACEMKQAESTIKSAAVARNDYRLQGKVANIDFVAKEVKYHHSCRRLYINLASVKSTSCETGQKKSNNKALLGIYEYIEEWVIKKRRPEYLVSLYSRYVEMCEDADVEPITSAQNLSKNLLKRFDQIEMSCGKSLKRGDVVFVKGLGEAALCSAFDYIHSSEAAIRKAALVLRESIKAVQRTPLPDNPSLNDLKTGEAPVPDLLLSFYRVLYGGANPVK